MIFDNLKEGNIYTDAQGNDYTLFLFTYYCAEEIWCLKSKNCLKPLQCFEKDFLASLILKDCK